MSNKVNLQDIERLERQVEELRALVNNQLDSISSELAELKKKARFELIRISKAAELLGVGERQVHNLASNPATGIKKYNKDGSEKKDSRKTSIRFNKAEIIEHLK